MQLAAVSLDDKYESREGRIHITGSQAIVRLAMMQFISRPRGGPRHRLLHHRLPRLADAQHRQGAVVGQPLPRGLAHPLPARGQRGFSRRPRSGAASRRRSSATAGTTGSSPSGTARVRGSTGAWTRSATATWPAARATAGCWSWSATDHALTSTDAPAAHEFAFVEMMMPFLYPATVHEVLSYGLHGIALSRFSGAWVGYKVVPDTVDASAPLPADPMEPGIVLPADLELPPDGLNLRIPDFWYQMEPRHRDWKLDAAVALRAGEPAEPGDSAKPPPSVRNRRDRQRRGTTPARPSSISGSTTGRRTRSGSRFSSSRCPTRSTRRRCAGSRTASRSSSSSRRR